MKKIISALSLVGFLMSSALGLTQTERNPVSLFYWNESNFTGTAKHTRRWPLYTSYPRQDDYYFCDITSVSPRPASERPFQSYVESIACRQSYDVATKIVSQTYSYLDISVVPREHTLSIAGVYDSGVRYAEGQSIPALVADPYGVPTADDAGRCTVTIRAICARGTPREWR